MQELNTGERTGFQVHEYQVEGNLAQEAKRVFGSLSDVDFPISGKFHKMRLDLCEARQVINKD
jgi:hypothetical protein